jgi:hypothetical protein
MTAQCQARTHRRPDRLGCPVSAVRRLAPGAPLCDRIRSHGMSRPVYFAGRAFVAVVFHV